MRLTDVVPAYPVQVQKSLRTDDKVTLTSGNAGKVIPISYVPLLREDRLSSGRMRLNFEMAETAEMLMNAINVTVYAHFIPHLAHSRFAGMDDLNRSYMGKDYDDGRSPPAFFETHPYSRNHEIYSALGLHWREGENVNATIVQAYNELINFRYRAYSNNLPQRGLLDTTLAACPWKNTHMAHIVPDFDQAMIDGEVPLNFSSGNVALSGNAGLKSVDYLGYEMFLPSRNPTKGPPPRVDGIYDFSTDMWATLDGLTAEMTAQGMTLSLANLELAKKTAAFAKLRSQYEGLEDDHIIDLLMQGIRVPEEQQRQPILLDKKSTIFGYSKRHATDAANLDKSVTTGQTFVDLNMRYPETNTGGIILITAEIVPEQLFERKKDYYLAPITPDDLPNWQVDELDPEKVTVVPNEHVDVDHDSPDLTFGYAPLNHQWKRNSYSIGGKYFRPEVDAPFDEDRQRIWANESPNPTLTEDFYLATNLHHKVFADQNSDAFEIAGQARFEIVGNTVFGKGLQEASDNYDKIMETVDTTRITQE